MSSITLAGRQPVLADRIFSRSLAVDLVLVAAGAFLTALLAQANVPLWPVPITGQTLAVLLVGATLGLRRGAVSLALYAVLGLVGLPVYAPQDDGSHLTGFAALAAPSFGYVIGFIFAAGLVGWLSERTWDRKFLKALATFVGGSVVVFAFGLPWLAVVTGATLLQTYQWGLEPFIIGGIIKAVIAAVLLPVAWWGAGRLSARRERDAD